MKKRVRIEEKTNTELCEMIDKIISSLPKDANESKTVLEDAKRRIDTIDTLEMRVVVVADYVRMFTTGED